ncbi:uncharacterized protein B0H64DRAFT_96495 [Chaetomium fimeti]|uniref:Uncharacterized protein n=1 Tax=Chaetomium fimeti TaxID=1854472 RepID=A0AAE0HMR6_9PEZI|nr:hypothetical protein B0H64DRAFT_96495 [Chaetomium fimeti]
MVGNHHSWLAFGLGWGGASATGGHGIHKRHDVWVIAFHKPPFSNTTCMGKRERERLNSGLFRPPICSGKPITLTNERERRRVLSEVSMLACYLIQTQSSRPKRERRVEARLSNQGVKDERETLCHFHQQTCQACGFRSSGHPPQARGSEQFDEVFQSTVGVHKGDQDTPLAGTLLKRQATGIVICMQVRKSPG